MWEVIDREYSIDNFNFEILEGGKYVCKYQFEFKWSIWEFLFNGFWQEIMFILFLVEWKLG